MCFSTVINMIYCSRPLRLVVHYFLFLVKKSFIVKVLAGLFIKKDSFVVYLNLKWAQNTFLSLLLTKKG